MDNNYRNTPPPSIKSHYEQLAGINLNGKTEKKGKFSYLSWAHAVDALMRHDPDATFQYLPVEWFAVGISTPDPSMGYVETSRGPRQAMVAVSVTSNGKTLTELYPVTDNFNKPITNPNVFDINTSYKRCLVKCIAMFGLGLYIYAGEDLPTDAT